MEQGSISPLELERRDTHLRRDLIVGVAREYFSGTALVEDKPWTSEDVHQVKEFLRIAAPFAHPRIFPSYWEHLIIASLYARKIAEKVSGLNLDQNEAEALQLLHDVGRLAIAHRYLRNDVVEQSIFTRAGVRKKLLEKLPSIPSIIGVKVPFVSSKVYHDLEDVSLAQRVFDVADNIGKRSSGGELFDIQTMLAYDTAQPARYTGETWPTERAGKKALTEGGKQQFAIGLLLEEVRWLRDKHNVHFEQLREEVAKELQKPQHQEILLALKNAQETLDPNTDRLLKRPLITTVVFDIGNVLYEGKDGEDIDLLLAEKLAVHFGYTREEAYTALVESLADGKGFAGKILEKEYLVEFWQRLGKTPPTTIEELRAPFVQPEIYTPINGMQEIVASLSKNPGIKIFCLSDAIAPVTPTVLGVMQRDFPQIKTGDIFVSNMIGAAKREPNAPAFAKLLGCLGTINPESVLFIDDKEGYTAIARGNYNIRGLTFRGNPYKGQTATDRVKQELQKAGII